MEHGYLTGGEKTEAGRNRIVPIPSCIPELMEFVRAWIQISESESLLNMNVHQIRSQFYTALHDCGISNEDRHLTPQNAEQLCAEMSRIKK